MKLLRLFSLIACSLLSQATILNYCPEIGVHYNERYLKALKRLKKEDYIFCYVGGLGLAGIGKVMNECDGINYKDPLYEGRIEQGNVYKD